MTESAVREPKATAPKAKIVLKKKAKTAASHPPTAQMVNNAIKNLKERGGSSLQAIKKYVASTYKVDAEKLAPFIKKYLKGAADKGKLIRTKGKGASGSFKLASGEAKKGAAKKVAKPRSKSVKPKKAKAKKSVSATASKTPKVKKLKTSKPKAAKKSPSKVKKAAKSPAAKKLKAPKPKKVVKKSTPKKK